MAKRNERPSSLVFAKAIAARKQPIMEARKADSKWRSLNSGNKSKSAPRASGRSILR
jgi:hypothetical protein